MSSRLEGILALPGGLARGTLRYGERIEAIDAEEPAAEGPRAEAWLEQVRRGERALILPGFIDGHVHGGGGGDTMDGPEGVRTMARFHLEHGTTTLLPTTITNPWPDVLRALQGVRAVIDQPPSDGDDPLPSIPGAHLEGPFLSPDRLGAQPPMTLGPTPDRIDEVLATGVVRVVTMAPEVEGALEAAATLARAGVRVSIGHTNAGYDEARAMIEAVLAAGGTVGFTHLYNAMTGLGSRAPGTVGAALSEPDAYAELILDLHHVHAASFRVAAAAKAGRLHLVTDAIRACGLPEGETELGGQRVLVRDGAARLPTGSLAGSVLTLDVALRNAVASGLSVARASALTSSVPAAYLGLEDRGELAPGKRADLVVLDGELAVRSVVVGGSPARAPQL
ncbi:MAG: N-acetylglucosamine-6-phosphate deacetylase [Deinococcales bacterium]|jgi:N-acetylglucosamine-6-phosphate deacetylase